MDVILLKLVFRYSMILLFLGAGGHHSYLTILKLQQLKLKGNILEKIYGHLIKYGVLLF